MVLLIKHNADGALLIFPKTQISETHGLNGGNDHKDFNKVSFFSYRGST